MADDNLYKWGVEFDISTDTASVASGEKAISAFQRVVDELGSSSELTDKQLARFTNRAQNLRKDFLGATSAIRDVSKSFDEVRKNSDGVFDGAQKSASDATLAFSQLSTEVRKIDEEIKNASMFAAGWGSTDPLKDAMAMTGFSEQDAQKVTSYYDAMNASAAKASQTLETQDRHLHNVGVALNDNMQKQGEYAKSVAGSNTATREFSGSLPTLRYAMYDVARTAGTISAAISGIGAGLLTASASYESSFVAVERTSGETGEAVNRLRENFLQLSREIPQSFSELANIGARGAQLGVASDQLDEFTETVAKFVATSDTVTLDSAVESFGRISNLLGDTDFNRIGSAITQVGINAAATEEQIVRTTQELAPFATAVGMSADETIGLAAALGSLGQPPERARSAFLTLQRVMDNAIASGSENLEAFAHYLNMTAEETAQLWQQDPGQFINAFASSLGSVEDLTTAFADLGINERRAVQVFQALASDARNAGDGVSVLSQAMAESAQGYEEGMELARQYGLIVETLESKFQLFKNALGELFASVGDALAPIAKAVLDVVTPLVQGLASLSRSATGKVFITFATAISLAVAGLAGFVGTVALTIASLAGMKTALDQLGVSGGRASISIKTLKADIATMAGTVRGGTTALNLLNGAFRLTLIGGAISLVTVLAQALFNLGQTAEEAFDKFVPDTSGMQEALAADMEAMNEAISSGVQGWQDSFLELPPVLEDVDGSIESNMEKLEAAATLLGETPPVVSNLSGEIDNLSAVLGDNTLAWFRNSMMQSEAFQKLASDPNFADLWEQMAIDLDEVLRIAAVDGEAGVIAYFQALAESSNTGSQAFLSGFKLFAMRLWETLKSIGNMLKKWWDELMSFDFSGNANADIFATGLDIGRIWNTDFLVKGLRDVAKVAGGAGNTLRSLGREARGAGGAFSDAGEGVEDFNKGLGGGGGGGGTPAAAEKAKQAIRTVLDYAKDLKGVWDRAFDLRFSVQISQDNTANVIQKIRDEAEKAQQKIRDLRVSIQELRAELSSLDAQISQSEYFLSIAIEYGDDARAEQLQAKIAELEADRAKKANDLAKAQKDLKKEQDTLNKSTKGNTQSARDNRATLNELFRSYRDQLGVLAESGASQEQLRKKSEQLRKEFVAQAKQLGFSAGDLKIYEQAFRDVTTTIERVPRNVTVEIRGLSAIEGALKEFYANLEKNSASAGRNAGRALGGGLGGGLGASAPEIEDKSFKLASRAGYSWNLGFGPVADPIGTLTDKLSKGEPLTREQSKFVADSMAQETNKGLREKYDPTGELLSALRKGEPLTKSQAKKLGQMMGFEVDKDYGRTLDNSLGRTSSGGFAKATPQAKSGASNLGRSSASSANQGLRNNFSPGVGLSAKFAASTVSVGAAAWNLGLSAASKLIGAIGAQFSAKKGTGSKGRQTLRSVFGFAEGGYTGRGGKYEPAGIVHRGEYVVPKHHVDQSTGLPKADAFQALARGQASPKGYRSGGYVQAPSTGGMVALTPGTIQQLALLIDPNVYLNGDLIADATSKSYVQGNRVGAN